MLKEAILHYAGGAFAYPVAKDTLMVQIRTAKDDVKKIYLFFGDRYSAPDVSEYKIMEKYASDRLFDYYRAKITIITRKFRYCFLLDDGQEKLWYNEFGFHEYQPSGYHSGYFQYPYIADDDLFEIPDWVEDGVIYQIFPERFCNGDKTNDPEGVKEWGKLPEDEMDFFGGDLTGIIEKLPYLKELGINAIYLTPIFEAETSHKYDTTDYFKIDPHFGDNTLFKELVEKCHKSGIRVILDGVFNHCGYYFPHFQDVLKNGEKSPYVDWFYIKEFPVKKDPISYEAFAEVAWRLPKLRLSNPEVREYILKVGEYWVKEYDIDGWRLDVANELPHAFWREFRTRIKTIKKDVYIIGEVWHHSGAFLSGDQFDGVMNYPFREAIIGFFGSRNLSVDAFDERLTLNRVTYRSQAVRAAWNLLDSHDTDRLLTRFKGDKDAYKLAVFFQMTYIGVPLIYYGDEIGLLGKDDPDCRRCMPWDEKDWDQDILNHYKRLINIYHNSEALRRGEYQTVYKNEATKIFVFKRFTEDEQVLVVINNNRQKQMVEIDLSKYGFEEHLTVKDLYKGIDLSVRDGKIIFELDAMGGVILSQSGN